MYWILKGNRLCVSINKKIELGFRDWDGSILILIGKTDIALSLTQQEWTFGKEVPFCIFTWLHSSFLGVGAGPVEHHYS